MALTVTPAMVTPAMEELVAAVDKVLAEDPRVLSQYAQLGNAETLLTQCNRIDYVLSGLINAMWSSDATIDILALNVKGWLVQDQHLSPRAAGARIAVARELLKRDQLAEALACGLISHDHALEITKTLGKFSDPADQDLVEAAKYCDPAALGRACRDLIQHLNLNESAEENYARLHGQRYLKLSTTFEGMTRIEGMLDPVTAAALKAALAPLSVRQGADDERSKPQRDHDALAAIIDLALRTGDLPDNGGTAPQIIITAQLDTLTRDLDQTGIPTTRVDGEPLPAAELRRLACDAGIIPAVMNGASEVLDLGRSSRTWSKAQRIAARLRDGDTCTWPGGCTIPIRYCQLHHLNWWSHGGNTNHKDSAHICPFHHWVVHHKNWTLRRDNNGTLQCRRT
jgi:hypothetical protein